MNYQIKFKKNRDGTYVKLEQEHQSPQEFIADVEVYLGVDEIFEITEAAAKEVDEDDGKPIWPGAGWYYVFQSQSAPKNKNGKPDYDYHGPFLSDTDAAEDAVKRAKAWFK